MTIKATVSADGKNLSYDFDAEPWFEQASDEEIEGLRAIGWGGGYAADDVAHWFADEELLYGVGQVLDVADQGFEVHIDGDDAEAWIAANRSAVKEPPAMSTDTMRDIDAINRHRIRIGGRPIDVSAGWTPEELHRMAESIRKHGREANPASSKLKRKLMR